jgi:hypothetical protein
MTTNEDDPIKADILGYLRSKPFDDVADYISRGRKFETIDLGQLQLMWVSAFKAFAAEPTDPIPNQLHTDLTSEYDLRRIDPPYDQIAADMEKLGRLLSDRRATMSAEELAELDERLAEDIHGFRAKLDKSC